MLNKNKYCITTKQKKITKKQNANILEKEQPNTYIKRDQIVKINTNGNLKNN